MPLLFAIVGLVALGLSFVVLVGPVFLIVGVIRAIRSARHGRMAPPQLTGRGGTESAVDGHLADAAFAELICREWPAEAVTLRHPIT